MNKFILIILSLVCTLTINAQNRKFLDGLRSNEAGKGTVTVTQSAAIDQLVNGNMPVQQQQTTQPQRTQQPVGNANRQNNNTAAAGRPATQNDVTNQHPVTKEETPRPEANTHAGSDIAHINDVPEESTYVDTSKKVMRNSYKMTGFRIQVYSGGNSRADRQKAERAGADMKRLFPSQPVYVHFYSPSWKCRMGNFKSQEEAHRILVQVKKTYPQACLVKGKISVQY